MGLLQLISRKIGVDDIAWGTASFSWVDENGVSHTMQQINASSIPTVIGGSIETVLAAKEPAITSGTTAQYWRGDKSWQTLNEASVGLVPLSTDGTFAADSDSLLPTQKATKTYVDAHSGLYVPVPQTVLQGPVTSVGLPNFMPASAAGLSITSQNISTGTDALVVTAAAGTTTTGATNKIGYSTTNLTWGSLTASNTNYLYLTINADGSVTTGSTILPPIYQWGGSASNSSKQFTFNIQQMTGYMGNGVTAPQANIVFVGEAVTSGVAVTSALAYALMGRWQSTAAAFAGTGTKTTFNHNIGTQLVSVTAEAVCVTNDLGWVAGEIAYAIMPAYNPGAYIATFCGVGNDTRNTCSYTTGASYIFMVANKTNGATGLPTAANWNIVMTARRLW